MSLNETKKTIQDMLDKSRKLNPESYQYRLGLENALELIELEEKKIEVKIESLEEQIEHDKDTIEDEYVDLLRAELITLRGVIGYE